MHRLVTLTLIGLVFEAPSALAKDTQFWNLTQDKIVSLQLSPAGQNIWGKDQTENDLDRAVDTDERLTITDTRSGTYDVRFTGKNGRSCLVANVPIAAGKVFTIEEPMLADCK